jgi:hypothetical protein
LKASFPEYNLDQSHFKKIIKVNAGYWKNTDNQRTFFDKLATKLNVRTIDDWYSVTIQQVAHNGGAGLLKHYNSSLRRGIVIYYNDLYCNSFGGSIS